MFCSFFISTYEAIKASVCDKVKWLYCLKSCDISCNIKDGKLCTKANEEYKKEILNRKFENGKSNTFKSSLMCLKEGGAIDEDEFEFISDTARNVRDEFAHGFFNQLGEDLIKKYGQSFVKMMTISEKINKWWGVNIEDFPEESECCFDIVTKELFEVLFGDAYEI